MPWSRRGRAATERKKAALAAEKRERERRERYLETVRMRRISASFMKADISPEVAAALVLEKLTNVCF